MAFQSIAVVGAGAWGTALANCAARAGRDVTLWARDAAMVAELTATRENPRLPGIRLDERVAPTGAIADVAPADAVLLVVPAQNSRTAAAALAPHVKAGTPIVTCAKGIERGTHRFMTEIISETIPGALPAILSGPSFASDVARGLPTAVTLACADEAIAVALARALGARTETLTGLSGLGDLILTCSSPQSRNFSLGIALGEGRAPDARLAEGAFTARALVELAGEKDVEMPIAAAVAAVLDGKLNVDQAIESLLTRPFKAEA